MAQAVIVGPHQRPQGNPCGICGGQSGAGMGFSPRALFSHYNHSTNDTYSSFADIQRPPTMPQLKSGQVLKNPFL